MHADINDLLDNLQRLSRVHPTEKLILKAIADLAERDGLESGTAALEQWKLEIETRYAEMARAVLHECLHRTTRLEINGEYPFLPLENKTEQGRENQDA